jgi:hypothetical protein
MTTSESVHSDQAANSGRSWEVVVERGKIAEFAAAVESENPAFRGPDAIAPPTFLTTAARWAPPGVRASTGFDRERLLHGEQEYVFHGPPPKAGDVLFATERLTDRYEKRGKRGGVMRFATVVTEYRDRCGALVAEAKATFIETARPS